jgi:hypothetical protein
MYILICYNVIMIMPIDKENARILVRRALYHGLLTKSNACHQCNSTSRLDGHHPDYTKPLEVEWLCRLCHKRKHIQLRKNELRIIEPIYDGAVFISRRLLSLV